MCVCVCVHLLNEQSNVCMCVCVCVHLLNEQKQCVCGLEGAGGSGLDFLLVQWEKEKRSMKK